MGESDSFEEERQVETSLSAGESAANQGVENEGKDIGVDFRKAPGHVCNSLLIHTVEVGRQAEDEERQIEKSSSNSDFDLMTGARNAHIRIDPLRAQDA